MGVDRGRALSMKIRIPVLKLRDEPTRKQKLEAQFRNPDYGRPFLTKLLASINEGAQICPVFSPKSGPNNGMSEAALASKMLD